MSEENVEAYKRAVEAANRRDLEALLEELDPEVEWYSAVVGMGSEVYRRAEGIREMFRDADETIPDAFLEVSEIRDLGDRLLSFGRLRARGMESGAQTEAPFTNWSTSRMARRLGFGPTSTPMRPSKPPGCGSRPRRLVTRL
jgi:ketosteroid isomerase-like protein